MQQYNIYRCIYIYIKIYIYIYLKLELRQECQHDEMLEISMNEIHLINMIKK